MFYLCAKRVIKKQKCIIVYYVIIMQMHPEIEFAGITDLISYHVTLCVVLLYLNHCDDYASITHYAFERLQC